MLSLARIPLAFSKNPQAGFIWGPPACSSFSANQSWEGSFSPSGPLLDRLAPLHPCYRPERDGVSAERSQLAPECRIKEFFLGAYPPSHKSAVTSDRPDGYQLEPDVPRSGVNVILDRETLLSPHIPNLSHFYSRPPWKSFSRGYKKAHHLVS